MTSERIVGASLGLLLFGCMAAPAAIDGDFGGVSIVSSRQADAYSISRCGHFLSTNVSVEDVRAVQERFSGDFLWVRRAGREYLIRDGRILDEAQALFAPLEETEPERAALARQQARLQSQQDALDREQEELEQELDRLADDPEPGEEGDRSLERRQRDLESRMRALEQQERKLEAVERSIERRDEEIERKAEAQLWRLIDRTLASGQVSSVRD
jgi:chromosome segregation ATPase